MSFRSKQEKPAGGDTPPAAPSTESVVTELTDALAATDRAPVDPGGAVEALAGFNLPGTTLETPELPRRGPGRPRKDGTTRPAPKTVTPTPAPRAGRRSMRDRLEDAEAEAAALRAQVAQLRPDDVAVGQCREALEGTFTIAGQLAGSMVHPTLDITPHAKKLADLWAVPLAPYMADIGESMPWIAAGLGTVVVLFPVYKSYAEATAEKPEVVPMATPLPTDVATPAEVGTHPAPHNFPRSMGVL